MKFSLHKILLALSIVAFGAVSMAQGTPTILTRGSALEAFFSDLGKMMYKDPRSRAEIKIVPLAPFFGDKVAHTYGILGERPVATYLISIHDGGCREIVEKSTELEKRLKCSVWVDQVGNNNQPVERWTFYFELVETYENRFDLLTSSVHSAPVLITKREAKEDGTLGDEKPY